MDELLIVWCVRGIDYAFLTKEAAEKAARFMFPMEDPDTRYGRISFLQVYTGEM